MSEGRWGGGVSLPVVLVKYDRPVHNIPEDAILHSHHREHLKSYKPLPVMKVSTAYREKCPILTVTKSMNL
jgi:hypothetical protein